MALAVSTVLGNLSHAIGGGEPSAQLGGPLDIINQAGRHLLNANAWEFTSRIAKISTVANQTYVELPSDLLQLDEIETTETLVYSVKLTTKKKLLQLRTNATIRNHFRYYAVVMYADNETAEGGAPQQRLELWPTPTSVITDLFTVFYRKRWEELTTDSKEVELPDYMDMLFLWWVREFAKSYEMDSMDQGAPITDLLDRLRASSLFRDAVAQDAQTQSEYGEMEEGHINGNFLWRDLEGPVSDPA